jgi:hypothetical protein
MFELYKMKAILNQYGFKIGYEKKNGRVIKTRIGSIEACRKAVASDFQAREADMIARNARMIGGNGQNAQNAHRRADGPYVPV